MRSRKVVFRQLGFVFWTLRSFFLCVLNHALEGSRNPDIPADVLHRFVDGAWEDGEVN